MLGLGTVGFLAPAFGGLGLYPIGAAVTFGVEWEWRGLLIFAVAQRNSGTPAKGTAVIQTGTSVGCVAGPLVFAALIEQES